MITYIDGPEIRITPNDGIFVDAEFYHTKEKMTGLEPHRLCPRSGANRYIALLEKEQEVKDSGFVGCVISPYRGKDIHDASAFSKQCDLMFEGLPFKAPAGWDSILKDIYGDYMTPPPPEKRVTNHEEIAYYL